MIHNFGNNLETPESRQLQENAFVNFGQGILFDDTFSPDTPTQTRRPKYYMVHMMDGSTEFYYLWHLVTSQYMHNTVSPNHSVLLQLMRYIGLAAEIDFNQEPKQSLHPVVADPENPRIGDSTLSNLKLKWLGNSNLVKISEDMLLMGSYWQRLQQRGH
jgi:hypothetical protein